MFRILSSCLIGPPLSVATRTQITWSVAIGLLALRMIIGWHFFNEGASKIEGGFSAAGFLQSSKGPLAGAYQSLLPDVDGVKRFNLDSERQGWDRTDLSQTIGVWQFQMEQVAGYYEYGPGQRKLAAEVLERHQEVLESFFLVNREDINKYLRGIDRRNANAADPVRNEVPSLYAQSERIASELRSDSAPLLTQIDSMWHAFNDQLNGLATDEQRQRRGNQPLAIRLPGQANYVVAERISDDQFAIQPSWKLFDVQLVNRVIPYFDLLVGIFLILGLFTRAAAFLAALFLVSVITSQWPGAAGATDVSYQLVEAVALLVLAAASAGRVAGLDFLLANMHRCRVELASLFSPASQRTRQETSQ